MFRKEHVLGTGAITLLEFAYSLLDDGHINPPPPSLTIKHMMTSLLSTFRKILKQNVFKSACDCKMILHFQMMNWVKILIVHVQILYRIKKRSIQLQFYVCVVKKNAHNYNLQNYSFMENMSMLKMR